MDTVQLLPANQKRKETQTNKGSTEQNSGLHSTWHAKSELDYLLVSWSSRYMQVFSHKYLLDVSKLCCKLFVDGQAATFDITTEVAPRPQTVLCEKR